MNTRSADLQVQQVPLTALEPWPGNARRGVVSQIKESMRTNGVFNPLVVQKSTNRVIIGNHRMAALAELHAEDPNNWDNTAPVIYLDVNDNRATKINLADNKTSDDATWDEKALAAQLEAIMAEDGSLLGTGFEDEELEDLLIQIDEQAARDLMGDESVNDAADSQDVEVPEDPISRAGDVWELGRHRLVCGDSTEAGTYRKLLGGEKANLIWTDPPYGISYVGKTKDKLTISNDGSAGLADLLGAVFPLMAAHSEPGAPVYVAHADSERMTFEAALLKAGVDVRQNLVWVKNTLVLGRSDYHYRHEPILYGFVPGGAGRLGRGGDRWYGDNAQTTVFFHDKPGRNRDHPTMKPIALVRDALANSLRPGGIVLDPFAGSGSTLLATDAEGGSARVIELDPRYADVICRRYQDLTGTLPIRDGDQYDFLAEPDEEEPTTTGDTDA